MDSVYPILKVRVYWNLHKRLFSVQVKGRVVAHATHVYLSNVTFRVSKAGRTRVLDTGRKNVHAFVVGNLINEFKPECTDCVKYNPYQNDCFFQERTKMPIFNAPRVAMCIVGDRPSVIADWR